MKGGSLPESSQNCVRYQTGDISIVLCWNRSDITEGGNDGWWYPDFPALLNAARAHTWPTTDLSRCLGCRHSKAGRPAVCLYSFPFAARRLEGEQRQRPPRCVHQADKRCVTPDLDQKINYTGSKFSKVIYG